VVYLLHAGTVEQQEQFVVSLRAGYRREYFDLSRMNQQHAGGDYIVRGLIICTPHHIKMDQIGKR
jgi:hypothetical protein